ncbi:helix-turn-helix domain-containing protein [Nocardia sp. ET3-3]|uniref:Helix-turn-helix domain-containing protein n=1 Tax=Nocardia terrae TaxID=2675851 RepID=A0A7K1UPA1_9NOCA|nr:helix-turn-helix transcriptional regulator [Nocardia terrae]MVU75999.1 helix-turn-helix domain-containing protein [Nocardia terrae]
MTHMEMFPGIENPTDRDRVGLIVAEEQLNLILGLRAIRIQRGMTVTEVADAMGVDPSQVSRFESGGTNPTLSTIRRYAKAVRGVFRVETRTLEQDQAGAGQNVVVGQLLASVPRDEPTRSGGSSSLWGLSMQVKVV